MTVADMAMNLMIDMRAIPPLQRHSRIFGVLKALNPKESFVIVSDHDPGPLHFQIEACYPHLFAWEYLEQGPMVWCVRIARDTSAHSMRVGS